MVMLDALFQQLFGSSALSTLITKTIEEETYTMMLNVTSTCPYDVEIGFTGHGGWLKSYAPANAKELLITVTGEWKVTHHIRLESRTVCTGSSLTIHHIQLVKGPENCLEPGKYLYSFVIIERYTK